MKIKLFLLVLLSTNLFAQPFYVKISSGYGLSTSPKEFFSYNFTTSSTTYESKSFSFGEGLYFNAALGYNISSSAGFELEFNYISGATLNSTSDSDNSPDSHESYKEGKRGKAFTIIPSFILSTEFNILKPYIKFGPILGLAGIDTETDGNATVPGGTMEQQSYTIHQETSYEKKFVWGINAALGMEIGITEIFAVTVEVISKSLSYSPDKLVLEKYLVNGVDRIKEIPEAQREVIFEEKVTSINSDGNTVFNKNPRIELPFSSLVGAVGIRINL